jgi:hypothetical protein
MASLIVTSNKNIHLSLPPSLSFFLARPPPFPPSTPPPPQLTPLHSFQQSKIQTNAVQNLREYP